MLYKGFHIWDFPDEVRILLEGSTLTKYFQECADHFKSKKAFARFLDTTLGGINFWVKKGGFVPLPVLRKTIKFTSISWSDLERNVIAYKSASTSKSITNPTLPIKETPELFEIISHLIFDGCVDVLGRPIYINTKIELHENMKTLIRKCFGVVYCREVKDKNGFIRQLRFSNVIPLLLKHFYDVEFGSLTAYLPNEVLLKNSFSKGVIKAVVDDEGHIRHNGIVIKLKNERLISQVRELFIRVFGKVNVSNIYPRSKGCYEFSLLTKGLKRFSKEITLSHPEKREFLIYAVKKTEMKADDYYEFPWSTKIDTLRLINGGIEKNKELSKMLFINPSNIGRHLKELEEFNFIRKGINGNTYIWSITNSGKDFLKNWTFEELPKKIQLPNWCKEFNLPAENASVILNEYARFRLFWALERTFSGSQSKIGSVFKVHRNTISSWKNGKNSIPINTINEMLKFLGDNGIDIANEMKINVQEIRYKNGIKLYESVIKGG